MKKIITLLTFNFFFSTPVLANIYLYELGITSFGGGIGGIIIFLIILYGAIFGSKLAKAIIWGWIMFFVTLGYSMALFSDPELDFQGIVISFLAASLVLAFFTYLAEKEKKKEDDKLSERFKSYNKPIRKRKKRKK